MKMMMLNHNMVVYSVGDSITIINKEYNSVIYDGNRIGAREFIKLRLGGGKCY